MTVLQRVLRIVTLPALVVVAVQTETARRQLVVWMDPVGPVAVAAEVHGLGATIDGADAGREVLAVTLEPVLKGVSQPTDLAPIPGHPEQLVVLSKLGTAYLGTVGGTAAPWFTVAVEQASELGLLGIAFHPRFADNGLFWIDATPALGGRLATQVSRWHVDPGTLSDPVLQEVVLEVAQPYANHDGGQIAFGPDGMLYVALGDGGYRNDPQGNGQNTGTLLGAILRIDVDGGSPYRIPADNPLVGRPGARGELWVWGLRNPWRFAFDPRGRLLVGDVGQNTREEIDLAAKGDNLGWRIREAELCFDPTEGCPTEGLVDPIWSYGRSEGVSVTGGVISTAPGPLSGRYVFGDFASGRLWALRPPEERQRVKDVTALGRFPVSPSAFARAPDGGVWVADFRGGAVYRLVSAP